MKAFTFAFAAVLICFCVIPQQDLSSAFAQSGTPAKPAEKFEKPTNLKVLPKKTSGEEVHNIMRTFSKSLGVRCTYCHVATKEGDKMKFDFASDAKEEKGSARMMMRMVNDINKKYMSKMDKSFEQVRCVTCHMGSPKPLVDVDSLPKKG